MRASEISVDNSLELLKPLACHKKYRHYLLPFCIVDARAKVHKVRFSFVASTVDKNADGTGAPGTILDDRLAIACGQGAIRIVELQRAGKAPMKAADFLRGTPLTPGVRFN